MGYLILVFPTSSKRLTSVLMLWLLWEEPNLLIFSVFSSPSKFVLGLIDFDISAEVCLHLVLAPS